VSTPLGIFVSLDSYKKIKNKIEFSLLGTSHLLSAPINVGLVLVTFNDQVIEYIPTGNWPDACHASINAGELLFMV
jgi:hypothetical protein